MPDGTAPPDPVRQSLSPKAYADLKRAAAGILRGTGQRRNLDVTSLAHDAYGRLAQRAKECWKSESHFLAAAAQAMRQILVDGARRRNALRRGGGRERHSISVLDVFHAPKPVDVICIDELLTRLSALDARQGRIVEMKIFTGLTNLEIAKALGISKSTVEDDWRHARAWLKAELADWKEA
jgi:RNA polymerase sigma-70 factor, ECF subfamily